MCLDLSHFTALLNHVSMYDTVEAVLLWLGGVILLFFIDTLGTSRRSRALRKYQDDVKQVEQTLQRQRRVAAKECMADMYRLIKR